MIDWWFGPSYLLGQVNFGIDAASVLGILLAAGGGGFYALRSMRPELSREQDIVIAAISLLCGLILIFKGWELNQIHEFNQFLLTGVAVFLAYDNIRMRAATVEQAKRRTPTVDRKRRTSRVYRAELDEIEPYKDYRDYYDDEVPRPERRRLKGTTVARPSRERDYDDRDDDYGDRETERRSRRGEERRWEERDEDYGDRRRPERDYERGRDAWDDADDDIDYDDTRGYSRYGREDRREAQEEVRDRGREDNYRDSYREERPRSDRAESRRDDWQDSRRGWRDESEERPQRSARDWRDGDRSVVEEARSERREDRRTDARIDARDSDWDEPDSQERSSVESVEERPNSDVSDWRGGDPNREERPPIPNVARRRSRPSEARPSADGDSRRVTTTAGNTAADYADYEPLDDD
ncbi:MAG: Ycf66 family protein, partial [Cyanobacteria bacterium J06641_5]